MWTNVVNCCKKVVGFFSGTSTPRRIIIHLLIVIGFLIPIWIAAKTFQNAAQQFADGWGKYLVPTTCTADSNVRTLPPVLGASDPERTRLDGQFRELQQRMDHHF